MKHEVTVTTGEIRDAWAQIQAGANPFSSRQADSATVLRLPDYRSPKANEWIGASGSEIQRRLEEGFYPDAADMPVPGGSNEIASPMMDLVEEEGDLVISAALAGDDLMRVRWEDFEAKRGLTIRACIGMHAGTNASVLADYYRWILQAIDACERRGIAPDVQLWVGTQNGFSGHGKQDTLRIIIPLVKAGEVIDQVAWRALLAPGAFRSLGFVAFALGADKAERNLNAGMGRPTNKQWAVRMDEDTLEIECPGGDSRFPADRMDAQLAALDI